jgi:hypothetical protein
MSNKSIVTISPACACFAKAHLALAVHNAGTAPQAISGGGTNLVGFNVTGAKRCHSFRGTTCPITGICGG